ncbi:MAG TPA: acyltransferase [Rhodanobacter sp.]|nr:acyltransferase [Rhodanobacter sp.]
MFDLLARLISGTVNWAQRRSHARRMREYSGISPRATIGLGSKLIGPKHHFVVGEQSYLNQAHLSCGSHSKVVIGRSCAIGYNVSIKAITHSLDKPTHNASGPIVHLERDIIIGNDCWIGDNVYIREGVTLGNNVIVGANSVVTRSVPDNHVIAGAPARLIKEL